VDRRGAGQYLPGLEYVGTERAWIHDPDYWLNAIRFD